MPANWTEFASVHFYNSSVLEYPRLSTRIEHNACTYQAVKSGSAAASHKPCVRQRGWAPLQCSGIWKLAPMKMNYDQI